MRILSYFKSFFQGKPQSQEAIACRVVSKMGYMKIGNCSYERDSYHGRTLIDISGNGLKLKVYGNGFSESEFLKWPADKKRIKEFVRMYQA